MHNNMDVGVCDLNRFLMQY